MVDRLAGYSADWHDPVRYRRHGHVRLDGRKVVLGCMHEGRIGVAARQLDVTLHAFRQILAYYIVGLGYGGFRANLDRGVAESEALIDADVLHRRTGELDHGVVHEIGIEIRYQLLGEVADEYAASQAAAKPDLNGGRYPDPDRAQGHDFHDLIEHGETKSTDSAVIRHVRVVRFDEH